MNRVLSTLPASVSGVKSKSGVVSPDSVSKRFTNKTSSHLDYTQPVSLIMRVRADKGLNVSGINYTKADEKEVVGQER